MKTMLTGAAPTDVERCVNSTSAFRHFAEPHWPVMERLARRLAPDGQADDVLQEALITAWRKRRQFDAARGTARTWLLAIVADKAQKAYRATYRRGRGPDVHAEAAASADSSARVDVRAAVAALAPRQRVAITLHYYLGLSTAEAATVMSCSIGTVKSTLSDARRQLKKTLGEDYRDA